ncbi:hypothetical protein HF086_016087 [Spodoptera exigua]|uniref:Retrotransposon gag domain-containing protein n=1 Tax=Spodoptera exigua TaxID=7107 RepID=A0A922M5J6_SPOEX|nr:hypothetical protein HF086_016087 [Spodoptera exigua]
MAYPIKFLSLQKAELDYEVTVRGGVGGDSVSELRKQIVKLSSILPSEDILESHLEPSEDLKAVKESLIKSHSNIISLKAKFDKNLFTRTENLLHHIYHRLNRINYSTPDVADIYKICNTNFNSQYKELTSFKPNTQVGTSPSEPVREPINVSVTCERKLNSEIGKLKFSGKTCVRAFIQKVNEIILSRSIPQEKILAFAFEIFTDDALHWYRCIKDKVETWDELVVLLKQDFSQSDYDYRLLAEIRARTQGELENITIYIAIMRGMFSRLGKSLPEEDQLEILLHNIRPCYASTLSSSADITDIDSLQSICRNYENIQSRLKQFREPPKVSADTVAPEFAYTKQATTSNSNNNYKNYKQQSHNFNPNYSKNYSNNYNHYNKSKTISNLTQQENHNLHVNEMAPANDNNKKYVYCPRCRSQTHSLGSCKKPHFPICFKCGRKDVKFPDCPNCNVRVAKN